MPILRQAVLGSAAAAALFAAAPAFAADTRAPVDAVVAADRLIDARTGRSSPWVGDLAGNAWWRQLSRCAGFFLASADGWQAAGDREAAASARGSARAFQDEALRRLSEDRGVTRAAALQVIRPHVGQGIGVGDQVWRSRAKPTGPWNRYRSQCLDLGEIHARL